MSKELPAPNNPRKMGLMMFVIAWGVLLILLVAFFNDKLQDEHNPNQRPESESNAVGQIEVVLQANRQHHYVVNGLINGHEVVFLLDTGATDVVIPQFVAEKIGLQTGRKSVANTANGSIVVYSTQLDSIAIGKIRLNNIRASINPAMDIDAVLLGMSALRQIEFTQRGNTLILRQ
jgi:aspartyl protease family protein